MKYSVITFGCRVNQADSLGFEEALRAKGATPADPDSADVVVVNTCSVTASADQGARQTVRRIVRTNPHAKVIVTGCYATRRPEEFQAIPNVLRVVSNDEKARLAEWLWSDLGLTTAERFGEGDGSCGAAIEPGVAGRTAFTLRVQTGCAQPCAYCIIPTTRGAPRSLPIDAILAEVDRVAGAGFKEIAITGVHLGSYGRDLRPAASLIELLRALDSRHGLKTVPYRHQRNADSRDARNPASGGRRSSVPDRDEQTSSSGRGRSSDRPDRVVRFRISSLEPMDCSPEIVDLVAEGPPFAPHFHLPLQHAADRMLTAMRRPYTIAYYDDLVTRIRRLVPSASIGTDVIVGFPSERDDDFEQLCEYLAASPLTHVHVFPYSDRPGTAASAMSGKVSGHIIRARASAVREIGKRLTTAFRQSQYGTEHRALTLDDGTLAVTGNYLKVRIPAGHARNEWVTVRIAGTADAMSGELIESGAART